MIRRVNEHEPTLLWEAMSFGLSDDPRDLADMGAYVLSRGHKGVETFWTDVADQGTRLRQAGVVDALGHWPTAPTGQRLADLDRAAVDRRLDRLIFGGVREVEHLLENLDTLAEQDVNLTTEDDIDLRVLPPLASFDFAPVLAAAANDPRITDGPLWEVKKGDLRRDREPWLSLMYWRMGYEDDESDPGPGDGFAWQVYGAARRAAFSDEWRSLRDALGVKRLDITIDYRGFFTEEPFDVQRSRHEWEYTLNREGSPFAQEQAPGVVSREEQRAELDEALTIARSHLSGLVAVTH